MTRKVSMLAARMRRKGNSCHQDEEAGQQLATKRKEKRRLAARMMGKCISLATKKRRKVNRLASRMKSKGSWLAIRKRRKDNRLATSKRRKGSWLATRKRGREFSHLI
jgi:hypothetical protein